MVKSQTLLRAVRDEKSRRPMIAQVLKTALIRNWILRLRAGHDCACLTSSENSSRKKCLLNNLEGVTDYYRQLIADVNT